MAQQATKAFDLVRNSCKEAVNLCKFVKIDDQKIAEFAQTKVIAKLAENPDFFKKMEDPLALPLKFEDITQEINFLVLYGAIQFGSGFRKELHEAAGRGAAETMLYGLMGMVLGDASLDADFFVNFTMFDIEQLFNFPIHVEVPSKKHPAIMMSVDSALKPLADLLLHFFNECGRRLKERQKKDFAAFVLDTLLENPTADHLVQEFVKLLPSILDDKEVLNKSSIAQQQAKSAAAEQVAAAAAVAEPSESLVTPAAAIVIQEKEEQADNAALKGDVASTSPIKKEEEEKPFTVYFYKKAQLIVAELYKSLHNRNKLFNFPDIYQMTVFVDNVLPAVLVKDQVLQLDEKLMAKIKSGKSLPKGRGESELRACALVACEKIIEATSQLSQGKVSINALQLDYFLWGTLGKEPEYRAFPRHSCKDTIYY